MRNVICHFKPCLQKHITRYFGGKHLTFVCVCRGEEYFINDPGFHILSGGYKQSAWDQLKFELSIDKVLQDVTDYFGLKLFYLIFENDQVKQGDNYHFGELPMC